MSDNGESGDGIESAFKSNLQQAYETGSRDAIEKLDRAELIYLVCLNVDVDTPEDHPSEHNGRVTRDMLKDWAEATASDEGGD